MSAVQVTCPKCAVRLRLPANAVPNSILRCSKCATPFRVPSTAPKPAPQARPQAVARPAKAAKSQTPHKPAAQTLKARVNQVWRDPKKRLWILGIGAGAVMAAGAMFLLVVGVGLLFIFGRGGSSQQLAHGNQNDATPGAKNGIIKLVKATPESRPAALDPKNKPRLVVDAGGHSARVARVMFTPDGKKVISVSDDKTIRIWDVATGETLRVIRVPIGSKREGSLFAGALSPDGKLLAVGGMGVEYDKNLFPIYLISLKSGQIQRTFKGHSKVISYLEFSPDGRRLASASNDTTGRIWDVATGETLHVLRGHNKLIRHIRFAPTGDRLATVSLDGTIRIWSTQNGQTVAVCRPTTGKLNAVAWNVNGQIVAGGTEDGQLYLWDRNGRQRQQFQLHQGERLDINFMTWTKNPEEVLYAGVGYGLGQSHGRFRGRAGIFNIASGRRRTVTNEHDNYVQNADVSPDGQLAVTTGGTHNPIFLWRTSDAKIIQRLMGKARDVYNVGWTPDGKSIAWTDKQGGYIPKKGQFQPLRHTFNLQTFARAEIRPGQQTVSAVLSRDGWSMQFNNPQHLVINRFGQFDGNFRMHDQRIISFSVLSNDRGVVGVDRSSGIVIFEMGNGKELATLYGHTGMITGLAPSPNGRYLASCSTDSTICIWSLDTYKLVMRLFLAEQDWIAWTPEGYYACSAFGERLMGWHVNNGREKTATFHPAVRFRKSLYKPAAIKLLLKTGDIKQALVQAGEKQNAAEPVKLAQVLPPQVEITSPQHIGGLQTGKEILQVTAMAQSVGKHPVTAMRLLLDGRPYQGDGGHLQLPNPALGQVQGMWNVNLPPGKHFIAVQAESAVSKAVSQALQVTRTGGGKELPNLYVLAVGVSEYPGRLRLRYAAADAVAIEKVFKEKTGGVFGKVETNLVTDSLATKRGIRKGLEWLKEKMTASDVGIIFFAGHGARDDRGKFYLVPVDISRGSIEDTCVSGDSVKRALANIPGRLIAMFDACHSGAAAEKKGGVGAVTDDLARDLVTEEYGIVVMCSSLGSEYSMESPAVKHGFFTLGLVKGLEGKADMNNDRKIFLHELDRFAAVVVRTLSGGRQNPVTSRPPTIRSFQLARP